MRVRSCLRCSVCVGDGDSPGDYELVKHMFFCPGRSGKAAELSWIPS